MNVLVLLSFVFLWSVVAASHHNRSTFNAYDTYNDGDAPVVKLPVEYEHYVNVIIGNPGKDARLRIAFGLNVSLLLFESPHDISKDHSDYPPTVLVYLGSALVRLGYAIDSHRRDSTLPVLYDGLIGFGYWSDIWRYWSRMTLSSHKLVLGAYDKNVARTTYRPFRLTFTHGHPYVNIRVHGENYTLVYDPSYVYSMFPYRIYRNITGYDLQISGHLHLEIEDGDIKTRLLSGFDRTLIRQKSNMSDTLIILGENFIHSFVLYYDAVTRASTVMASYDLFSDARAQPRYTYFCLSLFFLLSILWLSVLFTRETHDRSMSPDHDQPIRHHPKAAVFSYLEVYIYLSALLILFVESAGFARYRTMAFFIDESGGVGYYLIFCASLYISIIAGVGMCIYNYKTLHCLGYRRIFAETTALGLFWMTVLHWRSTFSLILLVFVASIYAILRCLQFLLAVVVDRKPLMVLSLSYSVLGVAFLIIYNIVPVLNFYYYAFDDQFYSRVVLFFYVFLAPLIGVVVAYPMAIIQNSTVAFEKQYPDVIRAMEDQQHYRPVDLLYQGYASGTTSFSS